MYWIGEPFLYLCYALVVGWLLMIRTNESDVVARVPKSFITGSIIGIGVFSFLPVLKIVFFFSDDLGVISTLKSVMSSFSEGKYYLWTLILLAVLLLLVKYANPIRNKNVWLLCILLIMAAMVLMAMSSHANAWYGTLGTVTQFLHFLSVTVWSGALFMVGWFKPKGSSWIPFLSWFHLTAVLAMTMIIASGLFLTLSIAPEYINSWILPYGQALLLKHLLIIPLMVFALFNGILIKRRLKSNPSFNPKPWAKAEAIIILLIYTVTGFMNQQSAPHNTSETLNETPPSGLFLWFHNNNMSPDLHMIWNPFVVIPILLACCCITGMFLFFRRKGNAFHSLLLGILFVVISYLAVMLSVSP